MTFLANTTVLFQAFQYHEQSSHPKNKFIMSLQYLKASNLTAIMVGLGYLL